MCLELSNTSAFFATRCVSDELGLTRLRAAFGLLLNVSNCHIRVVPRRNLILSSARLIDVLTQMDAKHDAGAMAVEPEEEDDEIDADAELPPAAASAEESAAAVESGAASVEESAAAESGAESADAELSPLVESESAAGAEAADMPNDTTKIHTDQKHTSTARDADIAAAVARSDAMEAEERVMRSVIRQISTSASAAGLQPRIDRDTDSKFDVSTDWKGNVRDVPHERPPAGPRRSSRHSTRPIMAADGTVNPFDVVFDDRHVAASPARKRQRRP